MWQIPIFRDGRCVRRNKRSEGRFGNGVLGKSLHGMRMV